MTKHPLEVIWSNVAQAKIRCGLSSVLATEEGKVSYQQYQKYQELLLMIENDMRQRLVDIGVWKNTAGDRIRIKRSDSRHYVNVEDKK